VNSSSKISVIIVFYNAGKFLAQAIDCVLAQTHRCWELLLVDDGSTDCSTEIAKSYVAKHADRMHFFDHDGHVNRGISATRNLGLQYASSEFVAFLDADDFWYPDFLERHLEILQLYPTAAMAYGPSEWWYSWTGIPADAERDFYFEMGVETNALVAPPKLLMAMLANEGTTPNGILWRKRAIDAVGGYDESFRGMYDDQVLFAKIFVREPVYALTESRYRYRKHADSCCSVSLRTGAYPTERAAFHSWLEDYLRRSNMAHGPLWRKVRRLILGRKHPLLARVADRQEQGADFMKKSLKRILARTPAIPAGRSALPTGRAVLRKKA
jgi:glycosyltransferase involved in cell wall biosynthesis